MNLPSLFRCVSMNLSQGVRSDLAVKVFGDDMEVLHETGGKISTILEKNPGGIRR